MIELAMFALFLLVLAAGGAVADRFDTERREARARNQARRIR